MKNRLREFEVPVEKLRWECDPESLGVTSTAEVQQLQEKVIAQDRAVSALKFGMKMKGTDYNIFVAGAARTGLTYLTRSFLEVAAKDEPSPSDWCYVHNFRDPDKPKAISLTRGAAQQFSDDMSEFISQIRSQIPEVFESDDYRHRREEAHRVFSTERNKIIGELDATVTEAGFILNMSQAGMMIVPGKEDHPITEEDLKELTEEAKEALREKSEQLQGEMNDTVVKIHKLERELKDRLKELDKRVALHAVGFFIDELQEKYADSRSVLNYLRDVKNDIIKNLDDFKQAEQPPSPFPTQQNEPDFTRYQVNVFIDNTDMEGSPVVYEVNPTYTNLFGAMERKAVFGALFTDFTMIRSGSMHRANGGYLVIQARDLLKWMISWEALKRALKNREIMIEDPGEMYGFITTKGMKPEPIPLQVKIILIGEPYIYHLLYQNDEQFEKLFKVKVHLDDKVDRTKEEVLNYAAFAGRVVQETGIRHIDSTGLARLIEYGVEIAGRQKKLTLKMALLRDILREADYWAEMAQSQMISRRHMDEAIRHKKTRSSLPEDNMREFLLDGYVNIETSGERVGQINGLSVYDLGDYAFGVPSRITASISLGRQGLINIDRESKLSGSIHTKGVLIMEGYLRGRYASDRPLTLAASLVFEQSYGQVDGDSASAAELFALLSSLSGLGLKQSLAVTGAISQQGEIQPIGGANEKIEGFFEVCQAKGLTGEQGVIIPAANVPDLMLKGQVIDAVKKGLFRVYAVRHADEALEVLTGMEAGTRKDDGLFPENTFNRLVEDKLTELAEKAKKLLGNDSEKKGSSDSGPPNGCDSCGK